ncbi:OLC1v1039033C1 [Oldenlandia corymbosa var. corymbosa]|uniref:OLC1v1039033C1 n=1 Tax=Oldenlandia corymbosa var. corymbosa TaxID=529605 RepID=A0AAV1D1T4_OLDCO|nr:OLC1v1039033C1 [Oldenlandia corymbosa var. corymbosa]
MAFGLSLMTPIFVVLFVVASAEADVYVVHMDKAKMKTLDASLGATKRWYDAVIEFIAESSPSIHEEEEQQQQRSSPDLLYVYETAISGFAAVLSTNQLESLKRMDGFLSAAKDELLSLHTTHTPQFLGLKIGHGLWSAPNLASDVIIGVVDTGIWPEHISFRDSGLPSVPSRWKGTCEAGTKFYTSNCNKKLIGARVFFKGYEAIAGRINETVDYRSPRDSEGHGTHTASTAAGNIVKNANFLGLAKGAASGMRFTSRIAAYKTCYALGCASSDILAAIDQAVIDGVDILSLSLGGFSRPYYSDNMAIASFGATANGVFVSSSAGNSGPTSSTVGNTAPWMMTVAASYIDRSFPSRVKLGNGKVFNGASLYYGKPIKQLPLVYSDTAGGLGAQYCITGSLSPKLVKGKIVVCDRGINSRVGKGEQVKLAGGAGMILLNTPTEGEELFADPHILPALMLGAQAATYIKSYLNTTTKATASLEFLGTSYNNPAPVMAAFSSRGPSLVGPDILKPDVTAPGVNILAAWPPNVSPTRLKSDKRSVLFNIVSGTSMSCPHVSGIAALLKSDHKDWSPAAIKSALMTTAYTVDSTGNPIGDAVSGNNSKFATHFAYGSGHIDPESAANPGLIYDITTEDYLTYLCSINYNSSQIAIFASISNNNFTCPDDSAPQPGDLNYPSFAVIFRNDSQSPTVTYKRTVTNVGIPKSVFFAHVSEPDGVSVTVEPDVLEFQEIGQKLSYKVSFTKQEDRNAPNDHSFGSLLWISFHHSVTSPIAVTWK